MGSYLYRFHPDDFRLRSRLGRYEEIADWPYGYEDIEPYYVRAEREVGVAGLGGATPFVGPRSAPYPLPPLDSHPRHAPRPDLAAAGVLGPRDQSLLNASLGAGAAAKAAAAVAVGADRPILIGTRLPSFEGDDRKG